MLWNFKLGELKVAHVEKEQHFTKRRLLSEVSSVFDPLGLVAPMVLVGKLMFQRACKMGLGWDDRLPEEEIRSWMDWKATKNRLKLLGIPKCIKPHLTIISVELHAFSDASEKAYECVVYARFTSVDHQVVCRLAIVKAGVAPLKAVTIPRLELTAATLAVRLVEKVKSACHLKRDGIHFSTDSMIVLHYIHNTTSRFETFVANRISKIRVFNTRTMEPCDRFNESSRFSLSSFTVYRRIIKRVVYWPYISTRNKIQLA